MNTDTAYNSRVIVTNYGTMKVGPGGYDIAITCTDDEAEAWANRPGEHWPCATLPDANGFGLYFDANGDLKDIFQGDRSVWVGIVEAEAWAVDVAREALKVAPRSLERPHIEAFIGGQAALRR